MLFQYNEIQENDVIMWGEPLNAVIDTAAMITLINDSLIPIKPASHDQAH